MLEALSRRSINDGHGCENVTLKVNSRRLKLNRANSISFNSSNVGKFFWGWILKDCVKVQEKKKEGVVLCPRTLQNVKLGIFMSYSCSDGKEMYKKAWCTCKVIVLLIQTYCLFASRLPSPSSSLKLHNINYMNTGCVTLFSQVSLPERWSLYGRPYI